MNGLIVLDKPAGMTSFACCAAVRRLTGEKKVGHAGTLDPMATGVLPLLLGKATRALDFLPEHDKRYTAGVRLGLTSDTLDITGRLSATGAPLPDRTAVEAALAGFRGDIEQIPPMVSAVHHNGERLYELARRGEVVERAARPVTVYALELLDYSPATGDAVLDCHCSAGTYIRTLADDLGRVLGCGAVLTALRRTLAAGYGTERCVPLEQLRECAAAGTLEGAVVPVDRVLSHFPALTVTAPQAVRFRNGGALAQDRLSRPVDTTVRVYAPDGGFLGLGSPDAERQELAVARLFCD